MNEYTLCTILLGILPVNLSAFIAFLVAKPDEWSFKYAFINFINYKPITYTLLIIHLIFLALIILTL